MVRTGDFQDADGPALPDDGYIGAGRVDPEGGTVLGTDFVGDEPLVGPIPDDQWRSFIEKLLDPRD
jgi:hypothetical protein